MKKIARIVVTFLILLSVSSCLIYFGSRNDAVSVAKTLKSGVLTADEIDVAFQHVGGKLIKRNVEESQQVKKGDVLLILDDVDTKIAIERIKAVINAQQAMIRQEQSAIKIEENEISLLEKSTWRKIEETQANLDAARAAKELAKTDLARTAKLHKTASASQSMLDNANNTFIEAKMAVVQIESQLAALMIGASQEQIADFIKTKNADDMTLQSIINSREKIKNRENQLEQLRAQLAQSNADRQQLEVSYSRLTLTAPEDGKILKVLYKEGEMIPVSAPAIILETARKYVDIYVNENSVNAYLPGTSVHADVQALNTRIRGVVRFATAAPSFSDLRMTRERGQADLTSYQIRIYMEDIPQLLTGMTIEVNDAQYD